tara:strand:- start:562 stop:720 length:159 start_codon:yes stop_codon:yes gene_type:complete
MKYIVTTEYNTYKEKSKDQVISMLLALYSDATGYPIAVTWPDGSTISYEGEE